MMGGMMGAKQKSAPGGAFLLETLAEWMEFTILTAAHSGKVPGATWAEIDLDAGPWVVPAERIKMGKEHRVPLSASAIALLKELPREVCEHALAHSLPDKVEAAYRRGDLLDKRVQLMKAWADYCAKPQAEASVTPIGRQRKTTQRPA
jgi:integrase